MQIDLAQLVPAAVMAPLTWFYHSLDGELLGLLYMVGVCADHRHRRYNSYLYSYLSWYVGTLVPRRCVYSPFIHSFIRSFIRSLARSFAVIGLLLQPRVLVRRQLGRGPHHRPSDVAAQRRPIHHVFVYDLVREWGNSRPMSIGRSVGSSLHFAHSTMESARMNE